MVNLDETAYARTGYCRIYIDESTESNKTSGEEYFVMKSELPNRTRKADMTMVTCDLANNTADLTCLSHITVVTEHADFQNVKCSSSHEKRDLESDGETLTEEGHHYSLIVHPEERKEMLESDINVTSGASDLSLVRKMSSTSKYS